MQDFTGVPAVVDLAALRDAMVEMGGDAEKVNPQVPVDLVIDHSVQVDVSGAHGNALEMNLDIEYHRNMERYTFLKWGQQSLADFQVVPPSRGIVHQVNLEYLAEVVLSDNNNANSIAGVYTDIDKMLEGQDLDAAIICTPCSLIFCITLASTEFSGPAKLILITSTCLATK